MKKIVFIFLLFWSTLCHSNDLIFEDFYHVKVIILSHSQNLYIENELDYEKLKFDSNVIDIQENNCLIDYELECLKYEEKYKLSTFDKEVSKIKNDDRLKLIAHKEWIQQLDSNAAIFFSGGFDYSEMLIEEDLDVNNLDILTNGKISEYEGNIKFKKGKFFTINFNLINRKILKNKSLFSNPTLHAEKLKYSNRITLNKLYYIDKGIFSFLIKVNKLN